MVYIYVLKLQTNKYYVGKTENPDIRLNSHVSGSGSAWTKKYKPIKIIEMFEGDKYDEDKYVHKYMDKYGIDNVRGGSYSKMKLTTIQKAAAQHINKSCNDRCFKCNRKGHFASNCYYNKSKELLNLSKDYESADEVDIYSDSEEESEEESEDDNLEEGLYDCDDEIRLFYNGEWYVESYSNPGHRNGTIYISDYGPNNWKPLKNNTTNKKCYRCGRNGHYSSKCYAKKHIKGYYLD